MSAIHIQITEYFINACAGFRAHRSKLFLFFSFYLISVTIYHKTIQRCFVIMLWKNNLACNKSSELVPELQGNYANRYSNRDRMQSLVLYIAHSNFSRTLVHPCKSIIYQWRNFLLFPFNHKLNHCLNRYRLHFSLSIYKIVHVL